MQLLSWNIQWCRGADGCVDPARIARATRELADADVICYQEVARNFPGLKGSAGEDQFRLLADAFPDHAAYEGIAVDVAGETRMRRQFGNLLLSRLPVVRVFRHLLPWPGDREHADMPRMALEVDLAMGVRVTTTHLAYYSRAQRTAQVEALRALHVQAAAHAERPARPDTANGPFHWAARPSPSVVTGDFNCAPETPEYARMLEEFPGGTAPLRDAWVLAHPGTAHAPTAGVYDRDQWPQPFCCDFAFVSADLEHRLSGCEVDQRTDASDHQPIILSLD